MPSLRKFKAIIYICLGGMIAWGYWQRGSTSLAIATAGFAILAATIALLPFGRLRVHWDDEGIYLKTFPRKARHIPWDSLNSVRLDHLGYHIEADTQRFRIRKEVMPEALIRRIRDAVKQD